MVMYECAECGRPYPSEAAAERCCTDGDGWDTEPMWMRGYD